MLKVGLHGQVFFWYFGTSKLEITFPSRYVVARSSNSISPSYTKLSVVHPSRSKPENGKFQNGATASIYV